MIEFIIIDENSEYLKINREIINKILMNIDISYKITEHKDIENIEINNTNYKIYIINHSNRKTIKLMRKIREEFSDWTSMIIITIDSLKLKEEIFNERLMQIDTIIKNDNYSGNLSNCILIALKNYNNRPKMLRYNYKNTYYNINLNEIIYIEKEKDNKKCTIKTINNTFPILGNLNIIEKKLDKRFIKSSRSYLINMEQVRSYNTKDNIIIFKDKSEIYEISRNKKKEIINYLRNIN